MNEWYFFIPWISFSILSMIAGGIFFFWGARAGQYKQQDRARYLPLWAHVPDDEKGKSDESYEGGR